MPRLTEEKKEEVKPEEKNQEGLNAIEVIHLAKLHLVKANQYLSLLG